MNLEKIEKFIDLAKEKGVVQLEYKGEDEKIVVTLPGASAPVALQHSQPVALQTPAASPAGASDKSGSTALPEGVKEITSPFVGTFYRAPSPGAENYVKVGDKIAPGKTLCIIEAMKIMNEIESDLSGEVLEICVENENYVEFGQVLFRVKVN